MPFKYSLNWFSNQYLAPSCCSLLAVVGFVVLAPFMVAGVVVAVLAPSTGLNMAAGGSAMANGTFSEKVLRDKTFTRIPPPSPPRKLQKNLLKIYVHFCTV